MGTANKVWDAVVVGAGPAGCAAAYDLAAAGRSVLLLDRAEFPRPKACAGGLTMKAVRALRYPIDPVVRRWERELRLEAGAEHGARLGRRAPVCAMTVREELDSFCLDRTRERGAVFRRVGALLVLEQEQDGVVLRFGGSEPMAARFVVGADGVHSRVRALATDASWFRAGFAIEANVGYRAGERFGLTFDFAPVRRGYGWLFPRDTHVNVGLYIENAAGEKIDRAALDRYIEARCGAAREHSRAVGQFLGLGAAGYRPEPGCKVLLAGDAAGFVDPLTGEGIYGAIRSGQAAAAAIHAALGGSFRGKNLRRGEILLAPGDPAPEGFVAAAESLLRDLRVAEHAAARFFAAPARGWALLGLPLLPRLALKAYSVGLPLGRVLRAARAARTLTG